MTAFVRRLSRVGDTGKSVQRSHEIMEPYEDVRFENVVDEHYHCPICMNVLKEPVMCQRNEHYFCNECITKHLENSQTCPTCMDKLTADTLRQPPRIVTSCLLNFKIRCDYLQRGCRDIVRLKDLKTHIESCGFSPVVCSNDGCLMEINKRDKIHHESEVCAFRRVKCHDCAEMKEELAEIKLQLGMMKEDIINSVKQVIHHNDASLSRRTGAREDIIVAAGYGESGISGCMELKSVEMFHWLKKTWLSLPNTKICSGSNSLVVYENQIISAGGGYTNKIEKMTSRGNQDFGEWSNFPARLPKKSDKQKCLVYQDRLFVIGGIYQNKDGDDDNEEEEKKEKNISNGIYEIKLSPPHTMKQLASLPQPRCYHGVERFDCDVFIFGGSTEDHDEDSLDSVLKYDIIKNKITEMTPLPFAMNSMATVACGKHAVLMGGCNVDGERLDTVLMYSFKTGQVKMLPHMLHKREGATAVITGNVIVVIGGEDENGEYLSSVESFSFDRYSWEELPPMKEIRSQAAAVLKPDNFS